MSGSSIKGVPIRSAPRTPASDALVDAYHRITTDSKKYSEGMKNAEEAILNATAPYDDDALLFEQQRIASAYEYYLLGRTQEIKDETIGDVLPLDPDTSRTNHSAKDALDIMRTAAGRIEELSDADTAKEVVRATIAWVHTALDEVKDLVRSEGVATHKQPSRPRRTDRGIS